MLANYLGPDRSVLAETLARQVGEHSPLFRKLSPTDSEALVQVLTTRLTGILVEQQAEFGRALDPLQKDGAVGRFLRSLREELESADQDRAEQLSKALAALDANDESSLLNRLVRETEQARRSLLQAINPDIIDSPMAVLKSALESLLKQNARSRARRWRRSESARRSSRKRFTPLWFDSRRVESKSNKAPRGGLNFQEAVSRFVHEAVKGGPYVAVDTGSTPGSRRGCKVGDVVVRFTHEAGFYGSAVVFEAKRDGSYTLARALEEMEVARTNREAEAGVFVLSASHAPAGFPRFSRYGKDLLVVWDDEDSRTDPYLHAALLAALSLASRKKANADEGDIRALEDVAERVEAEISRLGKMRTHNEAIRRNSDSVAEEIRKGEDKLVLLFEQSLRRDEGSQHRSSGSGSGAKVADPTA